MERGTEENPLMHTLGHAETKLQHAKRIRNYLESGATALCIQCEQVLLFCECTDLAHGEHVHFGWPSSYSIEEKKANLFRWVRHFQNELPKNTNNKSIFDLELMANDYLKKNIIDVLAKRKNDLEAMMSNHISVNNNEAWMKNYGNDGVMFLTDLNILCGSEAHW
eukprot:807843_1